MPNNTLQVLYREALAADDAFQAALVKQFGKKRAGDLRYQPNTHNAETRAAAREFHAAGDRWRTLKEEVYS